MARFSDDFVFKSQGNKWGDGSAKKVSKVSLDKKKEVANAAKGDLARNRSVFPAEGFARHPVVTPAEDKAADFYRNGQATVRDANGNVIEVAGGGGIPANSDGQPMSFGIVPRILDDFGDEEASIRLLGKQKGSNRQIDLIPPYTKFMLQRVDEGYDERTQIVETFGEYYVFFFGQKPIIYSFSGMLINSKRFNWLNDWKFMYQNFLRGTKSIENQARVILTYGGRQVEGFILKTANSTVSETEKGAPFNFSILIVDEKFLHFSEDFGLAVVDGSIVKSKSFLELLTSGGLSDEPVSDAFDNVQKVLSRKKAAAETKKASGNDQANVKNTFDKDTVKSSTGGLQLTDKEQAAFDQNNELFG